MTGEWAKAAFVIAFLVFGGFAITLINPAPWIILAHWVEERGKRKMVLAQARLKEAEAKLLELRRAL